MPCVIPESQPTQTAQTQLSAESSDVFPVSEQDVVLDLIRQAKDLSRPSLRRKALDELQERGLYYPDNRMGRTQTLLPPGKKTQPQQPAEISSSSSSRLPSDRLFKAAPPGATSPAQSGPFQVAMDTPRSTSSRISLMSDSASRVSHITDCAALRYRAMGGR